MVESRLRKICAFAALAVLTTLTNCKARDASRLRADEPGAASPPAAVVDMNADIPPRGRSAFDYVILASGGMPETFEGLVDRFANEARANIVYTMIPFGRSLQKYSTSLQFPRAIVMPLAHVGPATCDVTAKRSEQIYVAYSEAAKAAEVISYNEPAGRMEFQVIRDFGPGLKPKVYYARRGLCVSCHQTEGPLFNRADWPETTSATLSAHSVFVDAISQANGGAKDYHHLPLLTQVEKQKLREDNIAAHPNEIPTPPLKFTDSAAGINFTARASSDLLFAQKIWREGCGTDPAVQYRCHLLIAKVAAGFLFKVRPSTLWGINKKDPNYIELRKIWTDNWPKQGIVRVGDEIESKNGVSPLQGPLENMIEIFKPTAVLTDAENPLFPKTKFQQRPEEVKDVDFSTTVGFGTGTNTLAAAASANEVVPAFKSQVFAPFNDRFRKNLNVVDAAVPDEGGFGDGGGLLSSITPTLGLGKPCGPAIVTKCRNNLQCKAGVCAPGVPVGEACNLATDEKCAMNNNCAANVCTAPKMLGQNCDAASGDTCRSNLDCVSQVCADLAAKGEMCNPASGRRCAFTLNCKGGMCADLAVEDEACSTEVRCGLSLDCTNNICVDTQASPESTGDKERLYKALESEKLKPLLSGAQFEGWKIAGALLEELNAGSIPPECYPSDVALADPQVLNASDSLTGDLPPVEAEVASLMKKYCASCHTDTGDDAIDFMKAENATDLAKIFKSRNADLLTRISWESGTLPSGKQMPPKSSAEGKALRSAKAAADRFKLLSDLQALKEP